MRPDRILAVTGRTLLAAGVVVLLFVAYQLWGTGLQEARAQAALASEFEGLLAAAGGGGSEPAASGAVPGEAPTPADGGADEVPVNPPLSSFDDETLLRALFPAEGAVTARLQIPSIGVDKLVIEGVGSDELRQGPGHYRSSPQPGFEGNAAIAGHRTTYGQPFHDIDRLAPGDRITVTTLVGTFVYEVMTPEAAYGERLADVAEVGPGWVVVAPGDTWVLADVGDDRLTLTACHPAYSARQRIVVAARLVQPARSAPTDVAVPAAAGFASQDEPSATVGIDAAAAGLDGGSLEGDGGALLPALLHGGACLLVALVTAAAGRRWRRLPAYALGAAPVLVTMWLCFEQVDRLLPAY